MHGDYGTVAPAPPPAACHTPTPASEPPHPKSRATPPQRTPPADPTRPEAVLEPKLKIRAIVEVEAKDKGKAIGKQGRNISSIRHLAKRHHEIDEVQVI